MHIAERLALIGGTKLSIGLLVVGIVLVIVGFRFI